jgi:hypothetical protein
MLRSCFEKWEAGIKKPFDLQNCSPTVFIKNRENWKKSISFFCIKFNFQYLEKESQKSNVFLVYWSVFNQFFIQNSNFEWKGKPTGFLVYHSIFWFLLFLRKIKFWIVTARFFMNQRNWIRPILSVFTITNQFSSIFEYMVRRFSSFICLYSCIAKMFSTSVCCMTITNYVIEWWLWSHLIVLDYNIRLVPPWKGGGGGEGGGVGGSTRRCCR